MRFVADIDEERARAQAEKFGVPGFGSVEELLADDEIEIVVNLTIPKVHVEVAEQMLAAGKHVWSEKPFALDRESGLELLQTPPTRRGSASPRRPTRSSARASSRHGAWSRAAGSALR